jgi:hypothetical protein
MYIMKRTQLYLDDEIAKILSAVSRQEGRTISDLVRQCIREKFAHKKAVDKPALARQVAGLWKNREDLAKTHRLIRQLRKGSRRERLKRG